MNDMSDRAESLLNPITAEIPTLNVWALLLLALTICALAVAVHSGRERP